VEAGTNGATAHTNPNRFLFGKDLFEGQTISADELTKEIKLMSSAVLGKALNVNQMRHLFIAFSRAHLGKDITDRYLQCSMNSG